MEKTNELSSDDARELDFPTRRKEVVLGHDENRVVDRKGHQVQIAGGQEFRSRRGGVKA